MRRRVLALGAGALAAITLATPSWAGCGLQRPRRLRRLRRRRRSASTHRRRALPTARTSFSQDGRQAWQRAPRCTSTRPSTRTGIALWSKRRRRAPAAPSRSWSTPRRTPATGDPGRHEGPCPGAGRGPRQAIHQAQGADPRPRRRHDRVVPPQGHAVGTLPRALVVRARPQGPLHQPPDQSRTPPEPIRHRSLHEDRAAGRPLPLASLLPGPRATRPCSTPSARSAARGAATGAAARCRSASPTRRRSSAPNANWPGRAGRTAIRRGRHRGPPVGRERAPDVHHRQRGQGDAPGRLPAQARRAAASTTSTPTATRSCIR